MYAVVTTAFVFLVAASVTARQSSAIITVRNCSDQVSCSTGCRSVLKARERVCVPLTAGLSNLLLPGKFAMFTLEHQPSLFSDTQVFFNDPNCTTALQRFDTVCGSCFQYPPRMNTCRIDMKKAGTASDKFRVFVQTGRDAMCTSSDPITNDGLPPGVCYAHPGVPGLFLKYTGLSGCAQITARGFDDATCSAESQVSQTFFASGASHPNCFGGVAVDFE